MVEKSSHFLGSKLSWMTLAGEKDEAFHPVQIGLFSAVTVVPPPDGFARQIKKPRTCSSGRRILYVMVIHLALPLLNAALHASPVWRNVRIKGKDDLSRPRKKKWLDESVN